MDFVTKKCTKCLLEKNLDCFFVDKQKRDGTSCWCKSCKYQNNKKWSLENRIKHIKLIKIWESNNKKARRSKQLEWKRNNSSHLNELARNRMSKPGMYKKNYLRRKELNPHYFNKIQAKRRAFKLKAMPIWADKEEIGWHYKYAKELSLLDGIEYHVDHVIPLKHELVCGLHVEYNLQVITATENVRKSNTWQLL